MSSSPATILVPEITAVSPISQPTTRRRWPGVVIGLLVLIGLAYAGRNYVHELSRLASAPLRLIAAIAALYVGQRVIEAGLFVRAFAALGHVVTWFEAFFMLFVQAYTNMLIPRGGAGVVGGYLCLRRKIPVADFGAVQVLPLFVIQQMGVGIAGLLCQAVLAWQSGEPIHRGIALLFTMVIAFSAVLCAAPWPRDLSGRNVVTRFLLRLSAASRRVNADPTVVVRAIVVGVCAAFIRAARLQLAFAAIGIRPGFPAIAVASLLSDLMVAINITPAALGFREAAIVYAARLLGTTPDLALSAAVLDRLIVSGVNIAMAQYGLLRYIRPQRTPPPPIA